MSNINITEITTNSIITINNQTYRVIAIVKNELKNSTAYGRLYMQAGTSGKGNVYCSPIRNMSVNLNFNPVNCGKWTAKDLARLADRHMKVGLMG